MSSNPSSPSSAPTGVPPAFAAPESSSAGFRPHGDMDSKRTSEAGPALDKRSERRRPTLTGSDRKRRLVNTDGDMWSRRVVSGPGPVVDVGPSHRADLESRRISHSSSSSQTPSDLAVPGSSYATPIDLSPSPPRPTTARSDSRRSSWTRPGSDFMDYIRPRWQPDSEVTNCPICGMPFSFWYRKHHCRKCGRVVCASCSPHRITIPRQFIVHPPDPSGSPATAVLGPRARQVVDLDADDAAQSPTALNPALGGGEEVRLCNPCVPDPNPEPPRGYGSMRVPEGPLRGNYVGPGQARHRSYHSVSSGSRPTPYGIANDQFLPRPGRRTMGASDYHSFGGFGGSYGSRFHERPVDYYGPASASRYAAPPARSSVRSLPHMPSGSANMYSLEDPSVAQPVDGFGRTLARPTVSERDLCPICDQGLPPLGPNGNEDAREAHIRGCIESHGSRGRSPQQPQPQTGTSPVTTTSSSTPVRMISFPATEKDCLGQDGGTQECTICMEDYEVGQSLVRLECLCKFHKRCIAEWFGRKRECPVHKVS